MKTVIVTGGSRGIGASIVRSLFVRGYRVVCVARTQFALQRLQEEKLGGRGQLVCISGDISNPEVIEDALCLALKDNQELVGLVLNAGVVSPISKIGEINMEALRYSFDVNVVAAFNAIKLALPYLRKSGGAVIAISSGIVDYPAFALSPYCCSKAALETLIRVLAKEESDTGVLVKAIRPGLVETEMVQELEGAWDRLGEEQHQFLGTAARLDPAEVADKIVSVLLKEKVIDGIILDVSQI